MFDILRYGLSVAVVGIGVVFAALVILIALIKVMEKVVLSETSKKKISEPVKAEPAAAVEAAPVQADNGELIAVITAAIAAVLEAEGGEQAAGGFVVRSIRRVQSAPAWNRAGREEQVYSRM